MSATGSAVSESHLRWSVSKALRAAAADTESSFSAVEEAGNLVLISSWNAQPFRGPSETAATLRTLLRNEFDLNAYTYSDVASIFEPAETPEERLRIGRRIARVSDLVIIVCTADGLNNVRSKLTSALFRDFDPGRVPAWVSERAAVIPIGEEVHSEDDSSPPLLDGRISGEWSSDPPSVEDPEAAVAVIQQKLANAIKHISGRDTWWELSDAAARD